MVQIQDVTFGYKKDKYVLDGINLDLLPSKVYGLLGMNGVGKSTLIYLISNLLRPQKGSIYFKSSSSGKWQNQIEDFFLVPEEFDLPNISVKKFLSINAPFYPNFCNIDFCNYLGIFNIEQNAKLGSLSMGQKKKFLLSFAQATNTKLLILDEPTNGLDIVGKSQFREFILAIKSSYKDKCIILSTHQIKDVDVLFDNIIILHNRHVLLNVDYQALSSKFSIHEVASDKIENGSYTFKTANKTYVLESMSYERNIDLELFYQMLIVNPNLANIIKNELTK